MIKNLDEIKQNISVVDVIESYIPLRKNGANYVSNCPFHDENTPSFIVNNKKGIWHCFGCDMGGNAIDFIMRYEKVEFTEAVRIAGKICHIDVHEEVRLSKDEIEAIEIKGKLEDLLDACYNNLMNHEKLCRHLATRGFVDSQCRWDIQPPPLITIDFRAIGLGLALPKEDMIRIVGYQYCKKIGLLTNKDNSLFDNRLLFFIKDAKNKVVGLAGRVHNYHNFTAAPKYINSKDSFIYNKSKILYNLPNAIRIMTEDKKNFIYIVEGYFDALTCNLLRLPAVALCGTAMNANHLALLNRYIDERTQIIIMLDNDASGREAIKRTYHLMMRHGFVDCKVSRLHPDFKDINESYMHATKYGKNIAMSKEEALEFCLKYETESAQTLREKQARLKHYTDFRDKSNDKLVIDYFNTYLHKYESMNDNVKTLIREQYGDLDFILSQLAYSEEKRYIARDVLNSEMFGAKGKIFLDIMANQDNPVIRKYALTMPYGEMDNTQFYKLINTLKVKYLEATLKNMIAQNNSELKDIVRFYTNIESLKEQIKAM